jgi:hypothetical protein
MEGIFLFCPHFWFCPDFLIFQLWLYQCDSYISVSPSGLYTVIDILIISCCFGDLRSGVPSEIGERQGGEK